MEWKQKKYLGIKNNKLIIDLNKYQKSFKELIEFISKWNYSLVEPIETGKNRLKGCLVCNEVNKKIEVELVNYEDVQRLFMLINIINTPYKVNDDFVSFDVFLRKNHIEFTDGLDRQERTEEGITNYIQSYIELFKKYGTDIITSPRQFEGYYPEWT